MWDVSTVIFDMSPIYAIGLSILVLVGVCVVYEKIKEVIEGYEDYRDEAEDQGYSGGFFETARGYVDSWQYDDEGD